MAPITSSLSLTSSLSDDGITVGTYAAMERCPKAPFSAPEARCRPDRSNFADRAIFAGSDWRGVVALPIGDCAA